MSVFIGQRILSHLTVRLLRPQCFFDIRFFYNDTRSLILLILGFEQVILSNILLLAHMITSAAGKN